MPSRVTVHVCHSLNVLRKELSRGKYDVFVQEISYPLNWQGEYLFNRCSLHCHSRLQPIMMINRMLYFVLSFKVTSHLHSMGILLVNVSGHVHSFSTSSDVVSRSLIKVSRCFVCLV